MALSRSLLNVPVILVLVLAFTINVYGAVKYKDVPGTYWAFNEIIDVSDRGLIVGDASGNFKPDAPIDKFETARVLAKSMGYKYTNVSEEERLFYKQAYEKNKSIIAQYAKPYIKWKSAYDYEIAFLLEKEIITVEDLSQFIVKDANGIQQYRALSKQELAVYMVKLMRLKSEALAGKYDMNLPDDADIKKAYKPYIYYLLQSDILNVDEEGKINPNERVTRAELSVILSGSLKYIENINEQPVQDTTVTPTALKSASTTQIISLTGNITKFYPESDSIQIYSGSSSNIYKLASNSSIYVDSFLKTRTDLREGMSVKAVLSDNQLIDIKASSLSLKSSIIPVSNIQVATVEGILSEIRIDESGVAIDMLLMNQDGRPQESKTFVLDKNCIIEQDGAVIGADKLVSGDVVIADISGGICLGLTLEQRNGQIRSGVLLKKNISGNTNILEIKEQSGSLFELAVDGQTNITRQNSQAKIEDLRIGDLINVYSASDRLTSVSAQGFKTDLTGTILEIHIASDEQFITLNTADGIEKNAYIIPGIIDVYTFRIGMKVHLNLDSWDIESVETLS